MCNKKDKPKILKGVAIKAAADLLKKKYTVKDKEWTCCFPNCSDKAIKSHLLQRNGVLDKISEKSKVIGLKELPTASFGLKFGFSKFGIGDALTFPVFCESHDDSIFKSIETKSLDILKSGIMFY